MKICYICGRDVQLSTTFLNYSVKPGGDNGRLFISDECKYVILEVDLRTLAVLTTFTGVLTKNFYINVPTWSGAATRGGSYIQQEQEQEQGCTTFFLKKSHWVEFCNGTMHCVMEDFQ